MSRLFPPGISWPANFTSTTSNMEPPAFAARVVIPCLESSLPPAARAGFPRGWASPLASQLQLRRQLQLVLRAPPPLLVPMPYPLPIARPVAWAQRQGSNTTEKGSVLGSNTADACFITQRMN